MPTAGILDNESQPEDLQWSIIYAQRRAVCGGFITVT